MRANSRSSAVVGKGVFAVRAVPAIVLLATGAAATFGGIIDIGYGVAFSGAGAGAGAVAFGAGLLVTALVIAWVARGVWRSEQVAIRVAIAFSASVLVACAWVARTAFKASVLVIDPATNKLQPRYDVGSIMIALAIVPYASALACLLVAEFRIRRSARHRE